MLGLRHFRRTAIDLFQGDIDSFCCDVIVTATAVSRVGEALGSLQPDSGSPATVQRAADPLPAAHRIHTPCPLWQGGEQGEAERLASAYRSCLQLAADHRLGHIAFPALSAGAGDFPVGLAAELALSTVRSCLLETPPGSWRRITFVLADSERYKAYQKALFATFPEGDEEQP